MPIRAQPSHASADGVEKSRRQHKAETLDNSRPLDVHRWSEYGEVNALVDHVWELAGRSGYRNITKRHIKVVVLDLYVAWRDDPEMWIAVSRHKPDYRGKSRYNALHLSARTISCIDLLAQAGLIDFVMGHYVGPTSAAAGYKQGHLSRMRARPGLIRLITEHDVAAEMIDLHPETECIILRDRRNGRKVQLEYEDSHLRTLPSIAELRRIPYSGDVDRDQDVYLQKADLLDIDPDLLASSTNQMRENLVRYNNLLRWSLITIPDEIQRGLSVSPLKLPTETIRDFLKLVLLVAINARNEAKGKQAIRWAYRKAIWEDRQCRHKDFHRSFTCRIFNDGRFDHGGRFYGGWWQQLGGEQRAAIEINGAAVVEIDYKAMHLAILYAQVGRDWFKDFGGDPYHVAGYEQTHLEEIELEALICAFRAKHVPIDRYFFSGAGIELQYIDSNMAEYVINHFTRKDVPVLTVHDSFLVPFQYAEELAVVMEKAFFIAVRMAGYNDDLVTSYLSWSGELSGVAEDTGHICDARKGYRQRIDSEDYKSRISEHRRVMQTKTHFRVAS